jgi:thiol:disulfide interchange protein
MRGLALLLVSALLAATALPAARATESAPVRSSRATATLVSAVDSVAPGMPVQVGLRLRMAPGWHTYWLNPGDAGVAPSLSLTLPDGVTAGPVQWPAPEREREGPLTTYGYSGDLLLPVTLSGAKGATSVALHAEWLVCSNICVPESGDFRLDLPAGDGAASAEAPLFAATAARIPRPSPFPVRITADGTLFVEGLQGVREAWFAPDTANRIVAGAPQDMEERDGGLLLRLRPDDGFAAGTPLAGVLSLRDAGGESAYLQLDAKPGAVPGAAGPWRLLALAALGGAILNLMPCVFPVLALKTLGLAGLAGARRREAAVAAGSYAVGVLVAFAILGGTLLALRAAGAAAGWGFQFQSPAFVVVLAWVLFAVGLNLSGVYAIGGGRVVGAGQSLTAREGPVGSFFTGLLAVIVATPCTAPFMGAAVAGALAAPPVTALALFLAIGVGMALPYVLLALIPGVARTLPKPGAWMEVLRQAFAFPMYGASAWLVWVMSAGAGPSGVLAAVAGLVLVGFAAWVLGLAQAGALAGRRRGPLVARVLATVALLAALAIVPGIVATPPAAAAKEDAADAFSAARLADLRAQGKPVFVDATAAWCITCLVNERVALRAEAVRRAFAERGVTYLRADWTRQDPDVTAFLRANGRDGVPLYVFYPPGQGAPVVLPQILTEAVVMDAIGAPRA